MNADRVLREWSARHGDYDPDRSRVVRGWVRVVTCLARPLAATGVSPDAMTAVGVGCGIAAAASASRRRAALLVLATAVCDGLDGAIAVRRGRSSAYGALLDRAADRVTDCCFAVALARAGAPRRLIVVGLVSTMALETARFLEARRGAPVRVVTAGERPMRVAYTALGLAVSPTSGAGAVLLSTVVGAAQARRSIATYTP